MGEMSEWQREDFGSDVPERTYCEFVGTIRAETDKAFLVFFEDGSTMDGQELWIPKSQMIGSKYEHGYSGDIRIKKWLASKKGLVR